MFPIFMNKLVIISLSVIVLVLFLGAVFYILSDVFTQEAAFNVTSVGSSENFTSIEVFSNGFSPSSLEIVSDNGISFVNRGENDVHLVLEGSGGECSREGNIIETCRILSPNDFYTLSFSSGNYVVVDRNTATKFLIMVS